MRRSRLLAPLLLLAAAPAPALSPGLWQETLVFALDSVNGSQDVAAQMQSALPSPRPHSDCYTAADLAHPQDLFLAGAEQSCRFSHFVMANGRIEASGDCADKSGQTMHVTGTGQYSAAGYDFTFTGTAQAGQLALAFRGRDSGRRIGTCPAQAATRPHA